MIKGVMLNEKADTLNNIKSLKGEIAFLKRELDNRSQVIDNLIEVIKLSQLRINMLVETTSKLNPDENKAYTSNPTFQQIPSAIPSDDLINVNRNTNDTCI